MLAALATATGCGGDGGEAGTPASNRTLSDRLVDFSKKPPYVNALDVDPATGDYLLTTNRGFWRIDPDTDKVERVTGKVTAEGGSSTVGTFLELLVTGPGKLLGSGHPDTKKELPPYLGLIASDDGGANWRVVSRLGEADLHKIVLRHDRMYAIDAVLAAVLVSGDGGRTFTEQFTPRDQVLIDLEVDPGNPDHLFGSTESQLYRSQDGGKTWRPADSGDRIRLVWPAQDAFYRADQDGTVHRSGDGGLRWEEVGTVPGEPYKFKALDSRAPAARPERRHRGRDEGRRRHLDGGVPTVRRFAPALAVAALLGTSASAEAHSVVRIGGNTVTYLSADATSLNTLIVRTAGQRIEFSDRTVDGGIDPGSCDPGAINQSTWIVQVFCSRERLDAVRIDLGEREDRATIDLPLPATLLGGPGSDVLRAGAPADRVEGGDGNDDVGAGGGNDVVDGGLGYDVVRGDDGDDELRVADGLLDRVECGSGRDRVDADTLDDVAIDCEDVSRRPVVPPADAGTTDDRLGPRVQSGGYIRQRLGRGRVRLLATSSERGFLAASGFVDVSGISIPIQSDRRPVTVAGGGVELTVRLKGGSLRRCRRAVQRGRPCSIRMWVVGTDLAGNSTRARPIRIRLRR